MTQPNPQTITVQGTGSFIHVWEKHAPPNSNNYRYSIQVVFDPGYDYTQISAAINAAIVKQWGNNPPPGLQLPLHDPMTKPKMAKNPFYQGGKFYLSANSQDRVRVVDQGNRELDYNNEADRMLLFSGCIVQARVHFKAYTTPSQGVACYLNGIRIVDNVAVERLDSRESVEDMFGDPIAQTQPQVQGMPGTEVPGMAGMPMQPTAAPPMGNSPVAGVPIQPSVAGTPVPNAAAPTGVPVGVPNAAGYPSNPVAPVQPAPAQAAPVQQGLVPPVLNPVTGQPM